MKSLIIKAALMVAVALGVSNYVLYLMTGKTPFSQNDTGGTSGLNSLLPSTSSLPKGKPKKETVYKWVDENGVTHFSADQPMELPESSTKIVVGDKINIMDSPPAESIDTAKPKIDISDNIGYSPDKIKKLVEDAQNVEQVLHERHKQQQKMMGDTN